MPANLAGKLPGGPPRDVAPVTYQIIFLEAETLGPDDLIAGLAMISGLSWLSQRNHANAARGY